MKAAIIPLPPLKEQKRIVARVDRLMKLCDEMESRLRQARTTGEKFVESVISHLFAESGESATEVG